MVVAQIGPVPFFSLFLTAPGPRLARQDKLIVTGLPTSLYTQFIVGGRLLSTTIGRGERAKADIKGGAAQPFVVYAS